MNTAGSGKTKRIQATVPVCFVLAVLVGCLVILYAGINFQLEDIKFNTSGTIRLNEGWSLVQDGALTPLDLPNTIPDAKSGTIVLQRSLPDDLERDCVLFLKTDHQGIRVSIDGQVIYEFGQGHQTKFGQMFGLARNLVYLPEDAGGKTVTVAFFSPFDRFNLTLSSIMLGNESAVILHLLGKRMSVLVFCFLALVIGAGLIAISLILKFRRLHINHRSFLYLGIFSVMSALWIFTDTELTQFVVHNQAVGYLTSFFNFMLLPVPFLLYIRESCALGHKQLTALALSFIVLFLGSIALYTTGTTELIYTVVFVHILIIISLGFILYFCIADWRRNRSDSAKNMLIGLCVLTLSVFISLAMFYAGPRSDLSQYFRYGLLCFILVLSFGSVKKSVSLLSARTEAKTYKQLAFKDTMTMLGNRAAFDTAMQNLQQEQTNGREVTLLIFDLNNLKKINDTLGHLAGDDVIVGFADCLRNSFQDTGSCYRIGGDEFAVILTETDGASQEMMLGSLRQKSAAYNEVHPGAIDFAWGAASSAQINGLFNEADANMYRQKQHMGHGR